MESRCNRFLYLLLTCLLVCPTSLSCSEKTTEPEEDGFACIDYGSYTHPVSVNDIPGDYAYAMIFGDGVAYVPDGSQILIYDVQDPDRPSQIGSVAVVSHDLELSPDGSRLYSIGGFGLRVIDLSDPMNPVPRGYVDTTWRPTNLVARGNHIYVANEPSVNPNQIDIVDVSDPDNPKLVGAVGIDAYDLILVGDYLYVTRNSLWSLHVLDISTPTMPVEVISLSTRMAEMCTSGGYLYGGTPWDSRADHGVSVIDVSSPGSPVEVGFIEIPYGIRKIGVSGQTLGVGIDFGVLVLEFEDPTIATIRGVVGLLYPWSVEIQDSRLYVGGRKLHTIDISNPSSPPFESLTPVPGRLLDLVIRDDYAYLADRDNGVRVVQVEPATDPMLVETIPGAATDVALEGSLLCYLDGPMFQVLDVSSPGSPVSVGSMTLPATTSSLVLKGSIAYVGDQESGFHVVDLGDPTAPQVVGSLDLGSEPLYGMALMGNYVLVAASESGLQIIDVSNPAAPVIAGSLAQKFSVSVALSGSYAFVANGSYEMSIVDVSDPAAPQVVGTFEEHERIADMTVAGSVLYASSGTFGLIVLDISNPVSPVRVGSVFAMFDGEPEYTGPLDGRRIHGVYVSGDYVYIATSEAGLGIASRHCP